MIKAALPPPLHTMLLQGGHFERTDPTLYGGGGGGKEWWNCQKRPSVPLLLTRIVVPPTPIQHFLPDILDPGSLIKHELNNGDGLFPVQ